MQLAYSLLIAAISLLTTVSNNPNISAELKAQANSVANTAVTLAQNLIQEENTNNTASIVEAIPTPSPVVQSVSPTPIFGNVTPVSVPTSLVVAFNDPNNINFPSTTTVYGGNCAPYNFYVTVKDQNGKIIDTDGKSIFLLNPDTGEKLFSDMNYNSPISTTLIHYTPQQNSGSINLTFSDGNISTTTTIQLKSIMTYNVGLDGVLLNIQQQKGNYVLTQNYPSWIDTTTGVCVKDSVVNSQ